MELVDTHAHLDDLAFDGDREAVLERAAAAGVRTVVAIGTDLESSRRTVALAARYPQVLAAVGLHPHEAGGATPEAVRQLEPLLQQHGVVAIGETGLDHYRDYAPKPAQERLFRAHLELARDASLPVVIHCRDAYLEVLAILPEFPEIPLIFHAFSGSPEVAQLCLARGGYLAFGGPLTFRNARAALEVAAQVPMDRILLETDAPLLSPEPYRGKRNEPARVRLVAERLAGLRGMTVEAVAEATTANARRVFRLSVQAPA
jgi:TatD DNase family protein